MKKNITKIQNTKRKLFLIIILISFNIINFSFAATDGTENIKTLLNNITNNILTTASTVIMTAAFVTFFYGIVMFIYSRVSGKGDLKELEKGKEFMVWGLAALFVMVSVWGIIKLAQDLLGIKGSNIDIQPVSFNYTPVDTIPNTSTTTPGDPLPFSN